MKMETTIPFSGFYESLWSGEIDHLEEQEAEHMAGSEGEWEGFEPSEIQEVLFKHTDHSATFKAIAELYVDAWADWINGELDLDIHLDFETMTSPREYNFETDRIFAHISRDDIAQVYRKVGRKRLGEMAKEMFTSRSGFISFYTPDIDEWGPVREWDCNQLGALMAAAGEMADTHKEGDLAVYYLLAEKIDLAYQNNVDWPAVERDLQHMVDIENGEAEEDARKFPKGDVRDVHAYTAQFIELNHLREV